MSERFVKWPRLARLLPYRTGDFRRPRPLTRPRPESACVMPVQAYVLSRNARVSHRDQVSGIRCVDRDGHGVARSARARHSAHRRWSCVVGNGVRVGRQASKSCCRRLEAHSAAACTRQRLSNPATLTLERRPLADALRSPHGYAALGPRRRPRRTRVRHRHRVRGSRTQENDPPFPQADRRSRVGCTARSSATQPSSGQD